MNKKLSANYFYGDSISPMKFLTDDSEQMTSKFSVYLSSNETLDIGSITLDQILPFFSVPCRVRFSRQSYINLLEKSAMSKEENTVHSSIDTAEIDFDFVIAYDSHLVLKIQPTQINVYYNSIYYKDDYVVTGIKKLIKELSLSIVSSKKASIKLVCYNSGDFYTIDSEINPTFLEIEKYYNDDFLPEYKKLISFLHQRESGLVLLQGEVGTGKTNLIRYLLTTQPNNYVFITPSIASYLGNPEFISFLQNNKNSIFILEDCEQILQDRSNNSFGTSIANILNMTDGILSDIFNIKFICTFNAPETTIDPALLREGRCYCNCKFQKLSADKCRLLNKELNLGIPEEDIVDMSLAELFNYKGKKQTKTCKIGF